MKKLFFVVFLAGIAVYLGWLPFRSTEVSELLPVQTVFITASGKEYTVDIGAGVRAVGNTLTQALDSLKRQVSGVVTFETAEQVVANDPALLYEAAQEQALRPAAEVYIAQAEEPDVEALTAYFQTHHGGTTLSDIRAAAARKEQVQLPAVYRTDGGYALTR